MADLQRQLTIFGDLDPGKMYLHHMQLFLFIAEAGSCTYRDVEKHFHLSNAAASRSLNALSESVRHRKSAIGLIELTRDPKEGRRYRARLTKKGKLIYDQIRDA